VKIIKRVIISCSQDLELKNISKRIVKYCDFLENFLQIFHCNCFAGLFEYIY